MTSEDKMMAIVGTAAILVFGAMLIAAIVTHTDDSPASCIARFCQGTESADRSTCLDTAAKICNAKAER